MFLELKRRNQEVYYYKTRNNQEVDFALKEGKKVVGLLQVSVSLEDEKTRRRETDALIGAMEELKIPHAMLLTEDSEEVIRLKGKTISVKPVYQWLLETRTGMEG